MPSFYQLNHEEEKCLIPKCSFCNKWPIFRGMRAIFHHHVFGDTFCQTKSHERALIRNLQLSSPTPPPSIALARECHKVEVLCLTKTATVCGCNWSIFLQSWRYPVGLQKTFFSSLLSFSCQVGMQKFESRYRRVEVELERERKNRRRKSIVPIDSWLSSSLLFLQIDLGHCTIQALLLASCFFS